MLQRYSHKAIFIALVLGLACSVLSVEQTQAQNGKKRQPHADQAEKQQPHTHKARKQQSHDEQGQKQQYQADRARKQQTPDDRARKQQQHTTTAAQAAARAKAQYGGEVLKVTPSDKGYNVKLLTESGRVLTAPIQD